MKSRVHSFLTILFALAFFSLSLFFTSIPEVKADILGDIATSCITTKFQTTPHPYFTIIHLQLTNNCDGDVDFQNAVITFRSEFNLNTNFWGNFSPLSYPDNDLRITSQAKSCGGFLSSLTIHLPTADWAKRKLSPGQSFTIIYNDSVKPGHYEHSVVVYTLEGGPVSEGE